jgi:hypothetical protein
LKARASDKNAARKQEPKEVGQKKISLTCDLKAIDKRKQNVTQTSNDRQPGTFIQACLTPAPLSRAMFSQLLKH